MSVRDEVLGAALCRAEALALGHAAALRELLHPDFVWTSHTGDVFDRERYLWSNIGGQNKWRRQQLHDPRIVVVGDVAVLHCKVSDLVETATGVGRYDMWMTQTWVRCDPATWLLLAGHAGPRVDSPPTVSTTSD